MYNYTLDPIFTYRLGTIDYWALPTSHRRVGNASLEPRPAAEPVNYSVMNNNQLIRDGN